jgi:hypothetical protein
MKKLIVVLALVFVVGCQNPQKIAASWEGHNINDLIASWGAPNQVIDNSSDSKIMVWRRSSSFQMAGNADTTYIGSSAYTTYNPGQTLGLEQVTTFWVNPQGTIYRSSYVARNF